MKGKQTKNKSTPQQNPKKESITDKILELNTEFDETIYFNHHYTVFKKLAVEKPMSQTTIPFLMIREFLFSYFEEKLINKEADKESIVQIIGHIKQFSNSHDEAFLINFLLNIKTYAEMIGIKNTSDILVPALAKIVDESYHIKIQFLKSLLPFIDYLCSNGDEGISILRNNMINIILELYRQKGDQILNEEMKKLLYKNFIKIAKNILPYDKELYLLNIILGFGNEENYRNSIRNKPTDNLKNQKVNEHKILCIRYIRKLAEGFGKENAEKFFLPQLITFTVEPNDDIKKELLITLPSISEIVSYEFISNKIFDMLRRLSNDLNPNLRKICVNVAAKVIKIFKNKCRQEILNNPDCDKNNKKYSANNFINLVEKLSTDKENIVKFTIIEKIGEIISPLDKNELSTQLFNFYKKFVEKRYDEKKNQLPLGATTQPTSTPLYKKLGSGSIDSSSFSYSNDEELDDYNEINNMDNEYNKQITEEELNYYFAYNFPAMLYCYGKEAWSDLKAIYFDFCFEDDLKIRLSIIASFHEIANILGKEMTENELLPVYDKFLESNEKYEQKLAIKNLPKLLYKVNKKIKERYFKYFEPVSIFIDNTGNKVRHFNFINWKNKLNVIEGILFYYNLYDNDVIYNSILPQCITFCFDKYYKVRKTSAKVLATLIVYLYKENYKKDKLIKILETFAFHKKFQMRINFIKMCPILLGDENLFNEKIKEIIETIVSKDKILDVKIALAKVLKKIIDDEKAVLNNNESLHKICNKLIKIEVIKKILKDAKIKNISVDDENTINDSNEYKNIFKEDNTYFIEEFKIEIDKKENVKNNSEDNKNESKEDAQDDEGDILPDDISDDKKKENNEEKDHEKNEIKEDSKDEDKKEEKNEETNDDKKEEKEETNNENKEEKDDDKKEEKEETNDENKEEKDEDKKEETNEDKKEETNEDKKEETNEDKKEDKKEEKEEDKKEETNDENKEETNEDKNE